MEESAPLSDRELEVMKLVATGATNHEIARFLAISHNTVKVHLRNIYEKLGVNSRTEATMEAVRRGLVIVAGSGNAATAPSAVSLAGTLLPAGRPPIARWQRFYMIFAALMVVLLAMAPGWWRARSSGPQPTPFSDTGRGVPAPLSRAEVARWSSRAALPEARSRLAVVADPQVIYAIGGETAAGVSDSLTIFDPSSNLWTIGTSKPTAVANISAVLLRRGVLVPGGTTRDGTVTNVVETYDPLAASWMLAAPMPQPVAAYGLAVVNEKAYLFGGWDGQEYRADVWIYDPAIDSWIAGSPIPSARALISACALDGLIYVVGGYDGERELDEVLVYDPFLEGSETGPWSTRAPLGAPRAGTAMTALGPRLYVLGGGLGGALAYNEQYETQTGAWSRIATPFVGEWRNLGAAAHGQYVYAIGGWSGSYLTSTEEYVALVRQLLPLTTKGS